MGISTGCALIVGLAAKELPAELLARCKAGDFYDILSEDGELELDQASPWFDCDWDERIWGLNVVSTYRQEAELPADFLEKIEAAKAEFKRRVGVEAKVYVSPNVN